MSIEAEGHNITWFLPHPWRWTDPTGHEWHDTGAERNREGDNASGFPMDTPGIALPNHHGTLGGWWRVDFPLLGIFVITRQVDVGPDKSVVDLSAPLAYKIFGSETKIGAGPWHAYYLGGDTDQPEGVFNLES